jgi:hypothetical protein
MGTSPVNADTDGDGCGDKLEHERIGFDPLIDGRKATPGHCACPERDRVRDSDGDGLLDCEEFYLGSSRHRIDTDGDYLGDGLEHRGGSSPTTSNFGIYDSDDDKIPDWKEVLQHRLPDVDERGRGPVDAGQFVYAYRIEQEGPPVDGVQCYRVEVENIALVTTLGSEDPPVRTEGQNDLEIVFVQAVPDHTTGRSVSRFGRYFQYFYEPDQRIPNREFITIRPDELERL